MASDPEELFAVHQHRLFRYFCRAVGQAETARDLTQDVFLKVSQATIPVAADVEIRAWLFRIARNLAIDHHRERLRHPEPSGCWTKACDDRLRMLTSRSTRPWPR